MFATKVVTFPIKCEAGHNGCMTQPKKLNSSSWARKKIYKTISSFVSCTFHVIKGKHFTEKIQGVFAKF